MRTRDKLASELRKIAAQAQPANAAKYEAFAKRAETGGTRAITAADAEKADAIFRQFDG